ncbi:hypothetical protein MM213_09100 [Belliella sp. R4-6]|uniref:Outer membrane protein beta-barrel domain-containing protein n=1 Tax=Belliella alkalica TaxID=1730871 RepID=A0ABS9VC62_9BACT|nr:hypothetical protein [Belliella alkalica]MCH7413640.1 hypothetical protein [Belliella alkalica]
MIFQLHLYAQEEADIFTAKNSVYVELGGNSLFYSLNYSRILHQHDRLKISGSAGFSFFKQSGGDQISGVSPYWSPLLPVEITAFWGRSCHHLEVGTGGTFYSSRTLEFNPDASSNFQENKSLEAIIPLRIGYRYQQPKGGFFFRVGYTPGFNLSFSSQNPVEFHPLWGGISLGKSF